MKFRCQGCKDYKRLKQLPDYQVSFNHWCEMNQTPCALIRKCDFYPKRMKNLTKVEQKLNEFYNIFVKKPEAPNPPFI